MAKLPGMTREEEAEFWKTHSAVDYLDDMEPVEVEFHPSIKSARDLSPRCEVCDDVLLSRYIDVDIAEGRVTLNGLRQLYCRQGHTKRLAPEAERLVEKITADLEGFKAELAGLSEQRD